MRRVLLFLALCTALLAGAQQTSLPKQKPTFQGLLILPTQLRNPLFGRLTAPLGELDGSFQLPIRSGWGVGVGGKMMWWELQEHAFSQLSTIGDARRATWYGKLQYARYTGPRTFYELNLKAGMSYWAWDCSTCAEVVKQTGFHWGANAGYFVHATDNLAFGLILGYETDAADFSPAVICQEEFPGYTDRGGTYRFLTVGLGFSTTFERNKEDDHW